MPQDRHSSGASMGMAKWFVLRPFSLPPSGENPAREGRRVIQREENELSKERWNKRCRCPVRVNFVWVKRMTGSNAALRASKQNLCRVKNIPKLKTCYFGDKNSLRMVMMPFNCFCRNKKFPHCLRCRCRSVCVYYCSSYYKAVRVCGGGRWTCAARDDEPRPVWTSLPITHY